MEKCAFILGASGSVGKQLVNHLIENKVFDKVTLIGRRQLEGDIYKDFEQQVVDFDRIEEYPDAFKGTEVGFCCLGTTRSKAGAEGFVKVDHDYVVNAAKVAKANGCRHYLVVSSSGASATSRFLYQSTKGKMEEALKDVGFEQLSIFRPALLLGDRDEFRLVEKVAKAGMALVNVFSPTTGSVPTSYLAKAMVKQATQSTPGEPVHFFYNADIHNMAK